MPKQDVGVELFYDGTWHDIAATDDVFADTPIVIKRGRSDEGSPFRPCSIGMSLANDDDMYRTSNPESPLYGKAGRNTPLRVKVASTVRGTAEASSWAPDQSKDFRTSPPRGKAWVDLDAGGILQRIGQWTEPLRSPFYTYNAALTTLAGYWPMEDASGTVAPAFTPVAGAVNSSLIGVSFGSQQRPPGSGPVADVVLQDSSVFKFIGGTANSTSGWQYSMVVNMGSLGNTFFTPVSLLLRDGTFISFSLDDAADTTVLVAFDADGNTLFSSTNSWPTGFKWSGRWILLTIKSTYSAGTTTINAHYRALEETASYNPSGSYSGVTSSLDEASGSGLPDSSSFGHVIGTVGTTESLTSGARITALLGHSGETAADRFERLCDLRNIPFTIIGTPADSYPMGPQQVDTFPNHLKEIVTTEDGLLFDDIDSVGLVLVLRGARYSQTPALELVPADLPALPKEVTDDLDVHNIVTASQRDGGSYTAEDSTGPLGSQSPPDGVGEYRQTVDVNVDAEHKLPMVANWWLRRGTVEVPRFPQVTIDLGAVPSLIADVENVDVGSVITITGMREYVIRLIVIGWTETIGTHTRVIVFTCVPDQQFQVGEWDSTASRWDSRTTILDAVANATQTSLAFRVTDAATKWSTNTPYDVMIRGERITVTNMTAGSLFFGGWNQTATVVRSVNGVVKSHPSAIPIHVATPGRWAL